MISQLKEIYQYRQMLISSVRKDLRARYRGSVLGFLWTYINPLMQLVIYSIVFPYLLKNQEPDYPIFIFVGLLPWIFFTSSLQISTTAIVGNANLVKKIYFPRTIIPLSVATTGLMNYVFGLVIVFAALIIAGIPFTPFMLLLPVVMLSQFVFVAGLCLLLSSMYVYFRDLEHIVSIVLTAWFYLTPIVYNLSMFPERLQRLFAFNPMTQYVDAYRDVLMYGQAPGVLGFWGVTVFALVLFWLGMRVFGRLEKNFVEEM